MKLSTTQRRREETIRKAVIALYQGMSVRQAAELYRLPKSTVHDTFYVPLKPKIDPRVRTALTKGEELSIVNVFKRFAERGTPLSRQYLIEAVELVVRGMPPYRRLTLPFKDGKAGPKFLQAFMKRQKESLRLGRPLRQEFDRFKAVNADTICHQFCQIENLIAQHGLDETRIWNLDECGVTPGHTSGRGQQKRIMTCSGRQDMKCAPFSYEKRITFTPVISAAGDAGPCLFVLKGTQQPYRCITVDGTPRIDTLAGHLPSSGFVAMRPEGGGVDQHNFLEWAHHFVSHVKGLTTNGRKVLLIYDGYRSHMSLKVLQLFAFSNIIMYAQPAHSSGKLQPLDVVAFGSFKRSLNEVMYRTIDIFKEGATVYDIFDMITRAYRTTFVPQIITSGFLRSGIWPVDAKRLLSEPRPADKSWQRTMSVDEMEQLREEKRIQYDNKTTGDRVTVLDSGYVDTTKGAVLTSAEVLKVVTEMAKVQIERKKHDELAREKRNQRNLKREERDRTDARAMQRFVDQRSARLVGMSVKDYIRSLSPMEERRAVARVRAAQNRMIGK